MSESMKTALRKQADLADRIVKAHVNYKKSPKERITASYIETKLESLEKLWNTFAEYHTEMAASVDKAERVKLEYFNEDIYSQIEDAYSDYKSKLKDDLQTRKLPSISPYTASPISTAMGTTSDVKLPQIHLPKFSSGYEEWQTFHDMFESLIDKNTSLSAVQKLHYLKSCLAGEAEVLLKNLSTTELNYQEAWSMLIRRYNNKRFNANEIMRRLFSQKPITCESPAALKQILDTTSACLKSLDNLQVDTSSWDIIINYIVLSKLDPESRKLFESEISRENNDNLPTWDQLKKFIETRFRTLEIIEPTSKAQTKVNKHLQARSFHTSFQDEKRSTTKCIMCQGQHALYQCKQFSTQTPENRSKYVQSSGLCFNCLSATHSVKNCRTSSSCRRCGKRHHSLLHFEHPSSSSTSTGVPPESTIHQSSSSTSTGVPRESSKQRELKVVAHFSRESLRVQKALLATAIIRINSPTGNSRIVRALVDQGSEGSFISEATVQALGLKGVAVSGTVSGIGDKEAELKKLVSFEIESLHDTTCRIPVEAFVMKNLTSFSPSQEFSVPDWPEIRYLTLADPNYGAPGKIDVVLGSEVHGEIVMGGLRKHPLVSGHVAINTRLGWIVSGKLQKELLENKHKITSMHIQIKEDRLLKKFWEIEREPDSIGKVLTKEEVRCEEIYEETTLRNEEGRYIVRLPFNTPYPECLQGQSKEIALRRFKSLEKRLLRDQNLHEEYKNVIEDYLHQNHMQQIFDNEEINEEQAVYLPHHAVVRADKETSRVRVVFDASSKGVNNVSLNDNLLIGPKLQEDLRHLLMRWRTHGICIVADLVQMYRQVVVDERDTDFQRILWRSNPQDPIQHYRLLRLTFGTSCAPYLAVKTLQQLAKDEKTKYPIAAEITLRDYYMDDLLTGCDTVNEAIEIYEQMNKLMSAGGFQLQKWCSNSKELLDHINKENQRENKLKILKSDENMKVLGLSWNKTNDEFEYRFHLPEKDNMRSGVTKRMVLSEIARLYDPMGWISPIIITAKIFIQKLWKSKLQWDDELTPQLLLEWTRFRSDLPNVEKITIGRWLHTKRNSNVELHTFADASQSAYAAAVYLKSKGHDGSTAVHLITAKTKVAPVEKEISIPRLELCAALLATKLAHEVSQIMNISKSNIYAWSDSTVVLAWLAGEPGRWKTFVANRTSEILTMLDRDQWRHVTTDQNPADCASRGIRVTELRDHQLWWHGPEWLQREEYKQNRSDTYDTSEETRAVKALTTTVDEKEDFIWTRFSNLAKMLRILAYCKKFLNLKLPKEQRDNSFKTVSREETESILQFSIKETQSKYFKEEIQRLTSGQNVFNKSQLHTLHPVLDEKGLVRVGGRIHQAQVEYDKRHPVILPSDSHLTRLIILDAHVKTLHGGPQLMLNFLRSKYWIIRARQLVKKCYRSCVKCLRYSRQNNQQLMGQLPEDRLKPTRPFKISGVDFTGHINIRCSPGRGSKSYKGYICVFVCFFTKAVHLEAVSDLTSTGFIAAFRRFVSRRGHCQTLYSDNGTNFIGAEKELRQMFENSKSNLPEEIQHLLTNEGTSWKFIPPQSPNFGGLWEAGVRSTKAHLKRIIGESTLTFEELSTVLTQIEACLNSRPLSYLSENPDDPMPLTPGHFLVGEPLITIPDETCDEKNISNLRRWKYCQKMTQDFWTKWSNEYLVTLNQRYKWTSKKNLEPQIGDVVIIRDKNLPPAKWLMGKITEKHPGKDNITRVVSIQTKGGVFKRPCSKLCFLNKATE